MHSPLIFFLLLSLSFTSSSFAQNSARSFSFSIFFTEYNLKVKSEADTLSEGTLRTALLKAAALRHQNPFSLVKIEFENTVKKIRLQKNALPSLEAGFVSIDCDSQVIIDGSQVEDKKAVLVLDSHSNQIKNCEFTHFRENGILVLGNENILQHNRFTQSLKAYGIVLNAQASLNKINNNIFENLDTAIRLVSNTGWGNEFSQNFFKQISRKEIENNASRWDSSRINLKRISGSGLEIEIIGSLNEEVVLELYYSNNEKQWLPLAQKKVQVQSQAGEFKTLFNVSGIAAQNSFAVLATAARKNTSDFSNSLTHTLAKTESSFSASPSPAAELPKEEIKETIQKEIISEEDPNKEAIKDSTKEVPKVDPLFNSTKLPGFEATPPASEPSEKKSEINIQSNKKSGPSDSFKVEVLDGP